MGNDKNEYTATFSVDGRFAVEVVGSGIEDVLEIADRIFADADFGESEDVRVTSVDVKGVDGNHVYRSRRTSALDKDIGSGRFVVCYRLRAKFAPVIKTTDVFTARHLGEHYLVTASFGDMKLVDASLITIVDGDVVVYHAE